MKYFTLFIILIISTSQVVGQLKTTILLADSTQIDGKIMHYDEDEIKILKKGKLLTIAKDSIISPQKITIKSSNVYTIIETVDSELFYGRILRESDDEIIVTTSLDKKIVKKSEITYQAFYIKKYYEEIETFIETNDGNLFVGDVLKNDNGITLIDIGNGMRQEIDNELIIKSLDKQKSKNFLGKTIGYTTLAYLGLLLIFN